MSTMNTTDDFELEGIAQLEAWTWGASSKTIYPSSEIYEDQIHPLLNPIVLDKVFGHLVASTVSDMDRRKVKENLKSIRDLRRVCRVWNEELIRKISDRFTCRSTTDVEALLALATNPVSPFPFIREVCLKYSSIWKAPNTFKLLWTLRNEIKILEISSLEVEYGSWLLLPVACPKIQTLKISSADIFPDVSLDGLEPFGDLWTNPFPFLRKVKFSRGSFTITGAKLFTMLLENARNVEYLSIKSDEGPLTRRESGVNSFAEALTKNQALLQRLTTLKINNPNCSSFLQPFTTILQGIKSPIGMALECLSIVQRQGFQTPMPSRLMETTVSQLINEVSHTLRRLTIVNSPEAEGFLPTEDDRVGKLFFLDVMPRLQFLCLGNATIKVKGQKEGFTKLFPVISHFEYWIRIFNDMPDAEKNLLFDMLFPLEKSEENGMMTCSKNLTEFHIYTRFKREHERILETLAPTFPRISSLLLEIDGELLATVIKTCKDLPVKTFTLIYYEETALLTFDSAMTGILPETCGSLVFQAAKNKDSLDPSEVSCLKVNPSIADWKELTRLNISYRHYGDFGVVFLTYGLFLTKKLKQLELRHFGIKENLLIRLIKRMDLETLTLGNCKVSPINADSPMMCFDWEDDDVNELVEYYDKDTKVKIVSYHGSGDIDGVPYYARLLNHFEYDSPDSDIMNE